MSERRSQFRPPVRTPGRLSTLLSGVLLAVLLAGCGGPPPIVDLYVDPVNGNDADAGTISEPYKTLTQALSFAHAGQIIHLGEGTYDAANGEIWPSHSGSPPTAVPNVPNDVTITADGNMVVLSGPAGFDTNTALVFEGSGEVNGVLISGFEIGVIVDDDAEVVLDEVQVTASGEIGVLAAGTAELIVRDSVIHNNSAIGLASTGSANVTVIESDLFANHPAIEASSQSRVNVSGSDIHDNGGGGTGAVNSGVSVTDTARLVVEDTTVRNNGFAGVHIQGGASVTIGPGTDVFENDTGVVVTSDLPGKATLEIDGASIHDHSYQGITWEMAMGNSFKMRNTSVIDNGDSGLYFGGDADVIDLGTSSEPGNNDYSGNVAPHIVDNRPARAAPDGTVISISASDVSFGCAVTTELMTGPDTLDCNLETIISISKANNRINVVTLE